MVAWAISPALGDRNKKHSTGLASQEGQSRFSESRFRERLSQTMQGEQQKTPNINCDLQRSEHICTGTHKEDEEDDKEEEEE